jgi:hypothetical protein
MGITGWINASATICIVRVDRAVPRLIALPIMRERAARLLLIDPTTTIRIICAYIAILWLIALPVTLVVAVRAYL